MIKKIAIIGIVVFLGSALLAQAAIGIKDPHALPWKGSQIQFGLNSSTGNSNNTNVTSAGSLDFTRRPWNNVLHGNFLYGKSDGTVNKNRYYVQDQLSYGLNPLMTRYLFSNANMMADHFSPYKYQSVYWLGYGGNVFKTKRMSLALQAGPAYRRDKERVTNVAHGNLIFSTEALFKWQVSHNGALSQTLRYDCGKPYSYLKSVTAFTNKIIGNLAMQLSYTIESYSKIPKLSTRTHKTDTLTSVTLVYTL